VSGAPRVPTVVTEAQSLVPEAPVPFDRSWRGAPYPAVVVAADGTVRAINETGRLLFPDAAPGAAMAGSTPEWLVEAHHATHAAFPGPALPPVSAELTEAGPEESAPAGAVSSLVHGWLDERSYEAHPVVHDDHSVTWWLIDDTDTRLAQDALRLERERAAFLSEASTALLGSLNLSRCMDVAATLAAEHLADAALVIAPASRSGFPMVSCVRGERPAQRQLSIDPDELPGLGEAVRGFPPVPSRWIDASMTPDWAVPEGFGEVGSVVVTPLPGHGVPAGALVLLRRAGQAGFSTEEEIFARLFAARSGAAMSAARMFAQQAAITETLMRELLPPTLHQVGGVDFAGRFRPSLVTERVGGDFYDVHPGLDGEASLAVLGDVCGKGLDAAVLTGKVRNTLQALLPMAEDHARVLDLLNGALINSHTTRFVTLVLASVLRTGPDVQLRLTCAGHLPPLVVRRDGSVEEAATRGTLIGVLPDIQAATAEVTLLPGESCLLYTDGITEARGGPLGDEPFGEARLHTALTECGGLPAEAMVERVQMLASEWVGGGDHDDMAVLAITAPRGQHLTAVGGHSRGRYTA
jgi:serine phosphatase RsbU (regulator of sigma subunit)